MWWCGGAQRGTNRDVAQLAGRCAKILGEPGCRSQGCRSLESLPFLSSSHCTLCEAVLTVPAWLRCGTKQYSVCQSSLNSEKCSVCRRWVLGFSEVCCLTTTKWLHWSFFPQRRFPLGDSNHKCNLGLQTHLCNSDLQKSLRAGVFSQIVARSHLGAKPVPGCLYSCEYLCFEADTDDFDYRVLI